MGVWWSHVLGGFVEFPGWKLLWVYQETQVFFDSPSFLLEKVKRTPPAWPLLLGIFAQTMRLLLTEPFVLSKTSLAKDGSFCSNRIPHLLRVSAWSLFIQVFFPESEGWIVFWWNNESRRLEMSKPMSRVVMSQTPTNIFVLFDLWKTYPCNMNVTVSWSTRLISVISQGTDIHVLILWAMCVLKIYTKCIIYVCWKIDMSLVTSFFVLLEESEEHTSDLRSLRNNVAGCGDQKHLPRGVHRFSRPCMDVVGRKAIYEVVLRWVSQNLCGRFGYRTTYFWHFSYPFSKLRDLHAFGLEVADSCHGLPGRWRRCASFWSLQASGVRASGEARPKRRRNKKRKTRTEKKNASRHLTGESAT